MSLRSTSEAVAKETLGTWFDTPYGEGEDAEYVAVVAAIEQSYSLSPAQR
jgi:ribose 5-phosphate isomerase RpiB